MTAIDVPRPTEETVSHGLEVASLPTAKIRDIGSTVVDWVRTLRGGSSETEPADYSVVFSYGCAGVSNGGRVL